VNAEGGKVSSATDSAFRIPNSDFLYGVADMELGTVGKVYDPALDEPTRSKPSPQTGGKSDLDSTIVGEIQLLLAEKRTSLAALRTGIAVFVLPLSVLSVLTATSRAYDVYRVLHFILPLLVLCALLVVLGTYLIVRSVGKMRHQDKMIQKIKEQNPKLAEFID
jgi:hypothetical protein